MRETLEFLDGEIARNLSVLRVERGFSSEQLAACLLVAPQRLEKIEAGEEPITAAMLMKMADSGLFSAEEILRPLSPRDAKEIARPDARASLRDAGLRLNRAFLKLGSESARSAAVTVVETLSALHYKESG